MSALKKSWILLLLFWLPLQAQTRSLVTGGAGFLGSHLCERLLNEGHEVICVDNFYTGRLKNIEHLISHPNFSYKTHDVCEPFDAFVEIDEIYNLACAASPDKYQKDPINTTKTNVFGALNVLELARRCNAKIFQGSTSEIYGDPSQHPQKESYNGNVNPIGIRSCYDEGKRCAESLFFDFHRSFGVKIKVGRIFNTYGPRMSHDDGRVVSNFIVQALSNWPITIYGNGQQTRSFCYVDDLIEMIYRFMNTEDHVTGPLNLGSEQEYSMNEIAQLILQKTDANAPITFKPLPLDDPRCRRPHMILTEKTLDWKESTRLDAGLDRTIEYFQSELLK